MKERGVQDQYITSDGVKITICKPYAPRKGERTWIGNSKFSVFNLGAQAAKNGRRGARVTPDTL